MITKLGNDNASVKAEFPRCDDGVGWHGPIESTDPNDAIVGCARVGAKLLARTMYPKLYSIIVLYGHIMLTPLHGERRRNGTWRGGSRGINTYVPPHLGRKLS